MRRAEGTSKVHGRRKQVMERGMQRSDQSGITHRHTTRGYIKGKLGEEKQGRLDEATLLLA